MYFIIEKEKVLTGIIKLDIIAKKIGIENLSWEKYLIYSEEINNKKKIVKIYKNDK